MARPTIKFFAWLVLIIAACSKDKGLPYSGSGYPAEVEWIVHQHCATTGCHNSKSKDAAAGLNLESWSELFKGGRGGPAVIPFRPDFSTFCFYTNSFPELGPVLSPRMPLRSEALSREEYNKLTEWIKRGAPDYYGKVFPAGQSSQKIYVVNRQCDEVTIIDAESLLPVRYIAVGKRAQGEFPFELKVSPDKRHWYVSFFSPTGIVQKFDAGTDALAGELNLGPGAWSTFDISSDSRRGFFADNSQPGKLIYADLENMQKIREYNFSFVYPRGVAINEAVGKIYIGSEYGNYIYTAGINDPLNPVFSQVIVDGSHLLKEEYSEAPHYFEFSPDGKKYFVSCEASQKIRVLQSANDSLLAEINLPAGPAQIKLDKQSGYLFVSCPFDSVSFKNTIGSVQVINTANNVIIKTIESGFQPYGLGLLEKQKLLAVANANTHLKGPQPHHVSHCGGRNGNVSFIDLNTLTLVKGKKYELAVFPFAVEVR